MNRTVREHMTHEVVSATPTMSIKEVARLLAAAEVSALPVVDGEGRVVGVVSEADLLLKEERPEELRHHHRLEGHEVREEREKLEAHTVADVMTSPAITIGPDTMVREAARLMRVRGVKRLPVVNARGELAGIISRGDVVRIFLRSDAEIAHEIEQDVLLKTMWMEPGTVAVAVREGEVRLTGQVERKSLIPILIRLVETVDGVIAVDSRVTYEREDGKVAAIDTLPQSVLPRSHRHQ
ncbi:MAG TPA: CBS domain-containing protein [Actinomycetota bacterium]|nr:CBS domain-containing protein [Actinomycetota bacterium]